MKNLFIIILFFYANQCFSQYSVINPHSFDQPDELMHFERILANDTTYNVNFYHLDVEIALDSAYIIGNVNYLFTSKIDGLASLKLDLESYYTIDSIPYPASGFSFADNVLTINFANSYNLGDTFSFTVYYQGEPQLAGGYKGLRYEEHGNNELVIATLSTPYLAHTWWPCKDGTEDKSDSTFIDITIKDTLISSIPVIALSNGLLKNVETIGDKKTFKWEHRYPIVPYYVMVAISNYEHFQQIYNGTDYSFPIDYYVFESHLEEAQIGVAELPEVMDFFTTIFGPYPFLDEKYGMTQLGYYGGIENQTNTIINNMGLDWFGTSVHELAHSWFADMITCETWHHGWINEGFASYSEALYLEHVYGFEVYKDRMQDYEFYNSGTVYLEDISNPFNIFTAIIYYKGAYVLHMLRGIVGDDVFFDILYDYATDDSFSYRHATTEDFQLICEELSGMDLQYFFDQWIYDQRFPMYSYNYLFDEELGELEITILQAQESLGWRNVFTMPMEIKVEFADGTDTIVEVFNNSIFQSFAFNFDDEVINVELDPNDWILKTVQYDPNIIVEIKELEELILNVYPNPNNGSFNVNISASKLDSDIYLSICDLNMRVQYESVINFKLDNTSKLKINNLKRGVYFLNIITNNAKYSQKVVVLN